MRKLLAFLLLVPCLALAQAYPAKDTHAINHHLYKSAPDPFKTLEHISLMVTSPSALVAVTSYPPNNLPEIVANAKANPEKVTYSTPARAAPITWLRCCSSATPASR